MPSSNREPRVESIESGLESVVHAAVDGIIVIDEEGAIRGFNPAAERIFGVAEASVRGHNVSTLMPEPDRSAHDRYMHRYLETAEARIIGVGREVRGRRHDGLTFPMELAVGELYAAGARYFVGIVRDITARKEMEEALRYSERELQTLFDNAPIGIFTCGPNRRIASINRALLDLLDRDESEVVGRPFDDFADPTDEAGLRGYLAALARSDGTAQTTAVVELRVLTGSGSRRHITIHASAAGLPTGEAVTIAQVVDRTASVEREDLVRATREQLAHAGRLNTVGEMASAIAHEINQPLTAIATQAQAWRRMLKADAFEPAELDTALDQIQTQAKRASEIVKRIRALVTKGESEREIVSVPAILSLVLSLAEADARVAGVALELNCAAPDVEVLADPVQIQQVFLNLVRNAVDALGEADHDDPRITVRCVERDGFVEVTVEDNGPGLTAAAQQQLFEPFVTTKAEGMGLGLSISLSIVKLHGGRLWFEPAPGGGARFVFTLPVATA